MTERRKRHRVSRVDPDSLVLDLLVQVAVTAVASLVVKVAEALAASVFRQRKPPSHLNEATFARLREAVDNLQNLTRQAFRLIRPDARRRLGQIHLLPEHKLREYHHVREELFSQVRRTDELAQELIREHSSAEEGRQKPESRLPDEFVERIRFIEKRLRQAKVAALAEEAFLEIQSAILAMQRMLDQLTANQQPGGRGGGS
jgi:hypothetical protein